MRIRPLFAAEKLLGAIDVFDDGGKESSKRFELKPGEMRKK